MDNVASNLVSLGRTTGVAFIETSSSVSLTLSILIKVKMLCSVKIHLLSCNFISYKGIEFSTIKLQHTYIANNHYT